MEHETVAMFSREWMVGIAFAALISVTLHLLLQRTKVPKTRLKALGWFILAEIVGTHLYLAFVQTTWSVRDSLPLHVCRISLIVLAIVLISGWQYGFEWSALLGVPSGFHSLLTPEFTQGGSGWMYIDYYFSHSLLLVSPFLLIWNCGFKPTPGCVKRIFLALNLVVLIVGPLNFVLGSNYMYLARKPMADNPFLIGDWPWYILALEFIAFAHMWALWVIFRWLSKIRASRLRGTIGTE